MQKINDMTKKLIIIIGLVLSSMLMKAQAFFVPFLQVFGVFRYGINHP